MPTPFYRNHIDEGVIQKPNGVTGMGEKLLGATFPIKGKWLDQQDGLIRTSTGELVDYQGKFKFDSSVFNVVHGDTLVYQGKKYKVLSVSKGSSIPQLRAERTAVCKWLV